ncbi:AsmA family protein [Bordetella genomosp. 4]|uniref:AsmA family protein n=1 Tax=Bordetella genomosp. 4 TaxID=463044 RepID=A0A261TT35_9BORD|nr:AsmA family protein [Bordetella genomosp. 4]OZI44023.1 AsmA family protein [Bordetella genomosp. 4]OZI52421.1 AsmA family protein [Bordetella genomosp. 4]
MKTWFKRIVIGLVVLVLVAVVGLAIFLLTFDPNAYKYKLEEIVQERYHRTLAIDGDIELSLFPRIGLAVQGVSLSEVNSSETFASIESMRLAVAVWPLLSSNLVVDHVTINGFKVRAVRDKKGHLNFEDLVGGGIMSTAKPRGPADAAVGAMAGAAQVLATGGASAPATMQIDIAGLDLQSGELQIQDEISGMAVAVTNLTANTGRVTYKQPFDVTLSARVEGGNPRMDANLTGQGLLMLDPLARRFAAQKLDMRMDGNVLGAEAKSLSARGNLAFNGQTSSVDVSGLEILFQGNVPDQATPMKNVEASVTIPKLAMDPHKLELQLDKLAVRAKGALPGGPFELAADAPGLNISPSEATGQALTGRVRLQGLDASFGLNGISGNASELDIKEVKFDSTLTKGERVIKAAFSSPATFNLWQRAISLLTLRGEFNITDPGLPKGSLQIPVIGSMNANLQKDQAGAKINAVLEGGKFDLTADVKQLSAVPDITFALAVDTLDLDKLAPPVTAPAPKAPEGDGKQDDPEKKPDTAAPAEAPAATDGSIDLSALVGPTANGNIKIGQLVVRGLKASDLTAKLKLEKGKLDVSTLAASLYDGKVGGALSVDAANGNQIATKMTLAGISIGPLLTDLMKKSVLTGTGSLALDLKTAGSNSYALTTGLNGVMQLRLRDGAVTGINVAQTLRDIKASFTGVEQDAAVEADRARSTDFTSLEADLVFVKGVATAKRLDMASPLLRVSQGDPAAIDFVQNILNFVAKVRVVNTSTGQDGKDLEELKGITIPVLISGPFDKPVYTVQWRGVATEALKKGLEKRLKEALEDENVAPKIDKALKGILGK